MKKQSHSSIFSKRILATIVTVTAILVISISIPSALRAVTGSFNPFFIIASDSMVPTLKVGDLIVINQQKDAVPFESAKIGDIVAFRQPLYTDDIGQEIIMVHRVVEINKTDSGIIVIKTKGDHNPASIPQLDYPIYKENYIGKVVYDIPKAGLVWWLFTYPPITFGVIAAALIPSLYFFVFRKKTKYNVTS